MYRLLIVDDEAVIADGLFEVFSNRKEPELDVYKAYSGQDALSLLDRTRIDIILTDIRMPGMDGLQLLEIVHDRWPKCKVIFLTGYNEFEYIYKAIQYEGVSYLLKTEGYGKIINAVEGAVRDIENSFRTDALLQQAQEQLGTTRQLLQEIYLRSILKGELGRSDINQKQFDELDIPFNAAEPALMLIGRVDDMPKAVSGSLKTEWFMSIKLATEQYFSPGMRFIHFVGENSTLVWLFQPSDSVSHPEPLPKSDWEKALIFIKGTAELIQESFLKSSGKSVSVTLDDSPARWNELPDRFFTLKMLLNYRIGKAPGMLLSDKSVLDRDLQHLRNTGGKENSIRMRTGLLEELLEYGTREEFLAYLNDLTAGLLSTESMHDIAAVERYYSVALVLMSHINKWNLTEKLAFRIGLYKLMSLESHESWNYAVEYLRQLGTILFEIQNKEEEKRAQDVISIVQKHIMENIHQQDEVSLVRLAELVYFNPSYLSRLFKQITGINLSDYVSDYRVKKSKQLLENPEIKILEVAEAVGYGSATNFARFFKKLTNMTPQEYRDAKLIR